MSAPQGPTNPRHAIVPPTTSWRARALHTARLEEEARLHQLQAEVRSPTPSPQSTQTPTDSDTDEDDDDGRRGESSSSRYSSGELINLADAEVLDYGSDGEGWGSDHPVEEAEGQKEETEAAKDEIEEWSETESEKEKKDGNYGWDKIFSGTTEERKVVEEQLWNLCDRAEKEEKSQVLKPREASGSSRRPVTAMKEAGAPVGKHVPAIVDKNVKTAEKTMEGTDINKGKGMEMAVTPEKEADVQAIFKQWVNIRNSLADREERATRLIQHLCDFRNTTCQTPQQYLQLKAMMQNYESGRGDSILLPPTMRALPSVPLPPRVDRKYRLRSGKLVDSVVTLERKREERPVMPGRCLKCQKPYPATVGVERLRRCLACDLSLSPSDDGGGSSGGEVTTRYRRWRGFPYTYPHGDEDAGDDEDKIGRRKARLYRKRQKPFYDCHLAYRKEIVRQMEEHSRHQRKARRKRERTIVRLILKLLCSPLRHRKRG